jgi:hypothetical protein
MVMRQLRRLGLNPRLAWAINGGQRPGTVVSVRPGGRVPPGSTVIVYAARQPPGHQGNGHGQHGHGGDGGGGGDGNGNNGNGND